MQNDNQPDFQDSNQDNISLENSETKEIDNEAKDEKSSNGDTEISEVLNNLENSNNNTSTNKNNEKRPIYKKWWFWLIIVIVIVLIASGGNSGESNKSSSSAETSASSKTVQAPTPATDSEKAELKAAIDEANVIDLSLYTTDTAAELKSAIDVANKCYANAEASSADVKGAISRIKSAISQLKEKIKPVVLEGSGDDVVDIPSELSTCLVSAQYNGKSNFIIKTLDKSGDSLDLLVNTIGSYTGTTTTGKKNTAAAFLEINAAGPWTITLKPVVDAESITSGQQIHGDNVVMASTGASKKLSITNEGKSNFVVYGISATSSKLLVNEIGDYNGTVVNNGFSMFIVESEGDWSITW